MQRREGGCKNVLEGVREVCKGEGRCVSQCVFGLRKVCFKCIRVWEDVLMCRRSIRVREGMLRVICDKYVRSVKSEEKVRHGCVKCVRE